MGVIGTIAEYQLWLYLNFPTILIPEYKGQFFQAHKSYNNINVILKTLFPSLTLFMNIVLNE